MDYNKLEQTATDIDIDLLRAFDKACEDVTRAFVEKFKLCGFQQLTSDGQWTPEFNLAESLFENELRHRLQLNIANNLSRCGEV